MAPRRRQRRRRANTSKPVLAYSFSYLMNGTAPGPNTNVITFQQMAIDASRPIRIASASLNIATPQGAASMLVSLYGSPAGTSTGSIVARSAPFSVGTAPRSITVRAPRVSDFWTPASNDPVIVIDILQSQPTTGTVLHAVVSGIVRVQYTLHDTPAIIKQ